MRAATTAGLRLRRAYRLNFLLSVALFCLWLANHSPIILLAAIHDLFDGLLHYLNGVAEGWSQDPSHNRRSCEIAPLMPLYTSLGLFISVAFVGGWAVYELASGHVDAHFAVATLVLALVDLAVNSLVLLWLHGIEQSHAHSSWLHQGGDVLAGTLAVIAYLVILATGWAQADPWATVVGAIVIMVLCVHNSRESWQEYQGHRDPDH